MNPYFIAAARRARKKREEEQECMVTYKESADRDKQDEPSKSASSRKERVQ